MHVDDNFFFVFARRKRNNSSGRFIINPSRGSTAMRAVVCGDCSVGAPLSNKADAHCALMFRGCEVVGGETNSAGRQERVAVKADEPFVWFAIELLKRATHQQRIVQSKGQVVDSVFGSNARVEQSINHAICIHTREAAPKNCLTQTPAADEIESARDVKSMVPTLV